MVVPPQILSGMGYSSEQLDCAGLKLTLCEVFDVAGVGEVLSGSKSIPQYVRVEPDDSGVFGLDRGAYVIRYCEYVRIPEDSMALAIPRSTLIRSGATIFTAVWDPGYEGRGFGLMLVLNKQGIKVGLGSQVAQLIHIKLAERTAIPYRGTYYLEK